MQARIRISKRNIISWSTGYLPDTSDPVLNFSLRILGHILIGTPASPLKKALLDSGLGEDLAGIGMESELRHIIFSTGLKGTRASAREEDRETDLRHTRIARP